MLQNRHIFASVLTGSAVFMWGKYCSIEGKISHAVSVTQKPIELQGYVYAGKKKEIIMKQFWYSIIFNHLFNLSPSTPLWLLPQNGNFDVSNME